MSLRVRLSRAICRQFFGGDTMLCTRAELHRHPVRHLLNLAFRWRERDHCDASLRWEASTAPDEMAEWRFTGESVEGWRRDGLL